jgi:hypothetical protein
MTELGAVKEKIPAIRAHADAAPALTPERCSFRKAIGSSAAEPTIRRR